MTHDIGRRGFFGGLVAAVASLLGVKPAKASGPRWQTEWDDEYGHWSRTGTGNMAQAGNSESVKVFPIVPRDATFFGGNPPFEGGNVRTTIVIDRTWRDGREHQEAGPSFEWTTTWNDADGVERHAFGCGDLAVSSGPSETDDEFRLLKDFADQSGGSEHWPDYYPDAQNDACRRFHCVAEHDLPVKGGSVELQARSVGEWRTVAWRGETLDESEA